MDGQTIEQGDVERADFLPPHQRALRDRAVQMLKGGSDASKVIQVLRISRDVLDDMVESAGGWPAIVDEQAAGLCCPKCGSTDLQVRDSRPVGRGGSGSIRRRRRCGVCNQRFTTFEMTDSGDEEVEPSLARYKDRRAVLASISATLEEAGRKLLKQVNPNRRDLEEEG